MYYFVEAHFLKTIEENIKKKYTVSEENAIFKIVWCAQKVYLLKFKSNKMQ